MSNGVKNNKTLTMYTFQGDFFLFIYLFGLADASSAWPALLQTVEKHVPSAFSSYESLCLMLNSRTAYRSPSPVMGM